MMPLTFATRGQKYNVVKINGKDEQRRHLNNLGFVEGRTIEVSNEVAGNLIVGVKDSRIAVSKEMAMRIVVDNI